MGSLEAFLFSEAAMWVSHLCDSKKLVFGFEKGCGRLPAYVEIRVVQRVCAALSCSVRFWKPSWNPASKLASLKHTQIRNLIDPNSKPEELHLKSEILNSPAGMISSPPLSPRAQWFRHLARILRAFWGA